MINLWGDNTPTCRKIYIILSELGLPYCLHKVDLEKGEQFSPNFLLRSPLHHIPVLEDTDGPDGQPINLYESGAILLYLSEKMGVLVSKNQRERIETLQWLMIEISETTPLFRKWYLLQDKNPTLIEPCPIELREKLRILDQRLEKNSWIGGKSFSIADIAFYPWLVFAKQQQTIIAEDFPALTKWMKKMTQRKTVVQGMIVI